MECWGEKVYLRLSDESRCAPVLCWIAQGKGGSIHKMARLGLIRLDWDGLAWILNRSKRR